MKNPTPRQKVLLIKPLANLVCVLGIDYLIFDDKSKYQRVIGRGKTKLSAWDNALNQLTEKL